MRRVALLLTATALAAGAAAPAAAVTKTVHVPVLGCTATVETNDVAFGASSRGFYVYRWGNTHAEAHCSF